jgi:hypothetical protein
MMSANACSEVESPELSAGSSCFSPLTAFVSLLPVAFAEFSRPFITPPAFGLIVLLNADEFEPGEDKSVEPLLRCRAVAIAFEGTGKGSEAAAG